MSSQCGKVAETDQSASLGQGCFTEFHFPAVVYEAVEVGDSTDVAPRPEAAERRRPPLLKGGYDSQVEVKEGSKRGTVGIDHLHGTVPFAKVGELHDYLAEMCGGEKPEFKEYGRYFYQSSMRWEEFSIEAHFDNSELESEDLHGGRVFVSFAGTTMGLLDMKGLRGLCLDLQEQFQFNCGRLDACFNDFEKITNPVEVDEAAKKGNYMGFGVHTPKFKYKWGSGGPELCESMTTFGNRGSRGSGKYLRVYDKNLESKGLLDCVRWEVELSRKRAHEAFEDLCACETDQAFGELVSGLVGGSISFRDRASGDKNVSSRLRVLPWWEAIVEKIGEAKVKMYKKRAAVGKSKEWLEKQAAASLAMLCKCLGEGEFEEWVWDLVARGSARLTVKHEWMINQYLNMHGVQANDGELVPF